VASADSPRVRAYRASLGRGLPPVRMGVIIQEMLSSELAGVCFTANPVTGTADEFLIELDPGRAEDVVSGRATPDSYLFDDQIGRITSARSGAPAGTESIQGPVVLLSSARRQAVTQVARCAVIVQTHFGSPQDMEFGIQGSSVYVFQTRPIVAGLTRIQGTRGND